MKDKIIDVTIGLIKENNGNIDKITIREIAKRAEIGVGLINYHFQSKKNLIEICVQKIISEAIAQSKPDIENMTPIEKLKHSVKIPVDFLMENPEISTISVLNDLMHGQANDNSFKTLARYYYYAENCKSDKNTFFKTAFLIHGLQGLFLRRTLYREKFDLSDKAQRDKLIDDLVERLFGGENE